MTRSFQAFMRPAVLVAALASFSLPLRAERAYVVTSDQPAFAEAAKAALDVLGSDAALVRADDAAKISIASADVVVAVGPLAARLASSVAGEGRPRIVACLTPRAGPGAVSVPLQPSSDDVFLILRQVLPSVRRVGVFPSEGRSADELAAAARHHGLEVVLPKAGENFAAAADRLVGASDAMWIDDLQAVPSGGASLVVKKASEQQKHVVGPNRATVLQGAFFAVVPNPMAHGHAAGAAARSVLEGSAVGSIEAPAGRLVINGTLARQFQTKLSPVLASRTETVE